MTEQQKITVKVIQSSSISHLDNFSPPFTTILEYIIHLWHSSIQLNKVAFSLSFYDKLDGG